MVRKQVFISTPFYIQDILFICGIEFERCKNNWDVSRGVLGMILASNPEKYVTALSSMDISKQILRHGILKYLKH